jgi:acyl transferase domain-containing protein
VIGSAKTNFGHLEAAAGVAGFIKVVLALQHDEIPRHLHFSRMNPHVDTGTVPVRVPTETTPWPSGGARRIAGISAFGFSGTNAHVLVAEAPPLPPVAESLDAGPRLVVLSARTDAALAATASRLADHLDAPGAPALADVAFTLAVGRAHHATRAMLRAADLPDLCGQLRRLARATDAHGEVARLVTLDPQPAAFFFPASVPGALPADDSMPPAFDAALNRAIDTMRPHAGERWAQAMLGRNAAVAAEHRSAAAFALQFALAETLQLVGIQPAAVAGEGAGLAAAAVVAGALTPAEGAALAAAADTGSARALSGVALATPHTPLMGTSGAAMDAPGFLEAWHQQARTIDPDQIEALTRSFGTVVAFGEAGGDADVAGGLIRFWAPGEAGGPPDVSLALGGCYLRGVPVDWRAVYGGQTRRRVALPTYPFERQRYWIANAPATTSPAAAAVYPEQVAALDANRAESARRREALADALPADRDELLFAFVRDHVRAVLQITADGGPDRRHRLIDLGLDSLMVVELRNRLEAGLDLAGVLPATLVFDYPTIEAIAGFLDRSLREPTHAPAGAVTEVAIGVDQRPDPAIANVDELTDEQAEALLLQRLGNL